MYYVYLLKLKEVGGKEYYIGYTDDLKKKSQRARAGQD
jgi:predicted GIY-YIG superfamily endonuclease